MYLDVLLIIDVRYDQGLTHTAEYVVSGSFQEMIILKLKASNQLFYNCVDEKAGKNPLFKFWGNSYKFIVEQVAINVWFKGLEAKVEGYINSEDKNGYIKKLRQEVEACRKES